MGYKINKHIQCETNNYDEKTGMSYCILHTDIGDFEGSTQLHPEDKKYESRFLGCRIAEHKAYIKYLKEKRKIIIYQIKALDSLSKSIENSAKNKDISVTKNEIFFLKHQYKKEKEQISNILKQDKKILDWFEEAKELKTKYKNKKGHN